MVELNCIVSDISQEFCDRQIFWARSEIPDWLTLPEGWDSFGLYLDTSPVFPCSWEPYREELPLLVDFLEKHLLGTVVLLGEKLELLYIFHDAQSFCYYLGGEPADRFASLNSRINLLPDELKNFYLTVHNGFTFFPAQSMGPRTSSDFIQISELVDEDDVTFAENWMTVFSNGGGDYLCVDITQPCISEGLLWWHESPFEPDLHVDIFEIMDAWMAIFLEDIQSRDALLG